MDLTPTPTTALPTPTPTPNLIPKSPLSGSDTDTEAPPPPPPPPLQTHLQKSLSLSNGASFSHRRRHHHHHPPPSDMVVSYRECLKNHAASMGGLALDGCGEFMPAPNASPHDPTSLKCAACGCHRNFHRRDPPGGAGHPHHHHQHLPLPLPALQWTTHHHNNNNNNSSSPSPGQTSSGGGPSPSPSSPAASPTPHHSIYPSAPHMLLALSSAGGGPLYPDDLNPHRHHHGSGGRNQVVQSANLGEMGSLSSPSGRKRARTKFTPEQKVRMQDFAEKLGWKMLRGNDDKIVENFCSQVGVRRNVFKVWMHNNKHRKDKASNGNNNNGGGGDGNTGHGHGHVHFDDAGGDDDEDEEDDGNDNVVSVKYDLNGTIGVGGHHGNYEGRVRFDTNVFESKVHVHGSSAAAAAAVARSSPSL